MDNGLMSEDGWGRPEALWRAGRGPGGSWGGLGGILGSLGEVLGGLGRVFGEVPRRSWGILENLQKSLKNQ